MYLLGKSNAGAGGDMTHNFKHEQPEPRILECVAKNMTIHVLCCIHSSYVLKK